MTITIKMFSMHKIDIDESQTSFVEISRSDEDLNIYLKDLLKEISEKDSKRKFKLKRATTEFANVLNNASASLREGSLIPENLGNNLASRLLESEQESDRQMARIRSSHVRRGSLLQFLFDHEGKLKYLGVKIEHVSFIDENDFKKRIGLPDIHKTYKACLVEYSDNGQTSDVSVYDTNTAIARYWWDSFLELEEKWDDTYNTRTASNAVVTRLKKFKKDHPADYTRLKNATVVAFKQDSSMDYHGFVDTVIAGYQSDDEAFQEKIPQLVSDLKKLPEKRQFDTKFNIKPSAVTFRKRKVDLSNEIQITYDENIKELDSKIWATKLKDGSEVVVIKSPEGYSKFTKKEM